MTKTKSKSSNKDDWWTTEEQTCKEVFKASYRYVALNELRECKAQRDKEFDELLKWIGNEDSQESKWISPIRLKQKIKELKDK